ncbi:hypothetical protein D3OALGA1CA_4508 [Olavius algarvensis associated proteobacterium Delta 3]|nr:hypothetical protein D3OALGA1CA_4508 [Olavius algarvensis associated proteobacterium Delta 3]
MMMGNRFAVLSLISGDNRFIGRLFLLFGDYRYVYLMVCRVELYYYSNGQI